MMRPSAHPVACCCVLLGVVASVCTPLPTRTQQLPTFSSHQCWELLHPFAHHYQHGHNNSQHSPPTNVGSCCTRSHTTTNTGTTTPNILRPPMLGVVASVCTPLPTRAQQLPTLLAHHSLAPRKK